MRVTGRYSQFDTTRNPAVFYHFHQRTDANYCMNFIILIRILYNFHMKRNLHENYANIPLYILIPFTDFGSTCTCISRSRGIQIKIWGRGWFSMSHKSIKSLKYWKIIWCQKCNHGIYILLLWIKNGLLSNFNEHIYMYMYMTCCNWLCSKIRNNIIIHITTLIFDVNCISYTYNDIIIVCNSNFFLKQRKDMY